jgi:hypothetical protein
MGQQSNSSILTEKELRSHIERAVGRALVDTEYAAHLLADPTLVLEARPCPNGHYRSLRSINARDLIDFIQQARALFWFGEPTGPLPASTVEADHRLAPLLAR